MQIRTISRETRAVIGRNNDPSPCYAREFKAHSLVIARQKVLNHLEGAGNIKTIILKGKRMSLRIDNALIQQIGKYLRPNDGGEPKSISPIQHVAVAGPYIQITISRRAFSDETCLDSQPSLIRSIAFVLIGDFVLGKLSAASGIRNQR